MVAQKGKDLLLKIDSTGLGQFDTVAGLRSKNIAFNTETVDVTNADSQGQWRELLACGVKTVRVSGSGIFKDETVDDIIRQYFFDGTIRDWQIIIPDFGTVEGSFQISGFEYAGQHNNELTFEITIDSAGELTFTAL